MATAVDEVHLAEAAQLDAELVREPPVPEPAPPIRERSRYKRAKWAVVIGLVIAVAVIVELWRMQSQNALHYETVPVERGPIQASVTATGTLNAVVDVQVGSQVSGNIKALYADFNTLEAQVVKQPDVLMGLLPAKWLPFFARRW